MNENNTTNQLLKMNNEEKKVSIFRNYTNWIQDKCLLEVLNDIKDGKYSTEIQSIRNMIFLGDGDYADTLKKKLQAFTPSGTFHNGRKAELISTYSRFIVLDIDKLSDSQLYYARNAIINCQHTYSVFISPSGNGLKVIVPVNSMVQQHKQAYQQVSSHYESLTDLQIDQSGKDVSRACFIAHDAEAFINPKYIP